MKDKPHPGLPIPGNIVFVPVDLEQPPGRAAGAPGVAHGGLHRGHRTAGRHLDERRAETAR